MHTEAETHNGGERVPLSSGRLQSYTMNTNTFTVYLHTRTCVFCLFWTFGHGAYSLQRAVVMEMWSACQLKSSKHLFVLSPASHCAPRLNTQKKSDSEQIGCAHRLFFISLPPAWIPVGVFFSEWMWDWMQAAHNVCVDMCVFACVICSLPRF